MPVCMSGHGSVYCMPVIGNVVDMFSLLSIGFILLIFVALLSRLFVYVNCVFVVLFCGK